MILNYWGLVRAKRIDTEEWIEGTYYRRVGSSSYRSEKAILTQEVITHLVITKNFSRNDSTSPENFFEVIPETICPYIGRNDRNGNKIFVHDVIKPNTYGGEYFEVLPYEKKNTLSWNLGHIFNTWEGREVVIIGNTIDDPTIMERCPDLSERLRMFYRAVALKEKENGK